VDLVNLLALLAQFSSLQDSLIAYEKHLFWNLCFSYFKIKEIL